MPPTRDSAGRVIVPVWRCTGWGFLAGAVAGTAGAPYRTVSPLPAALAASAVCLSVALSVGFPRLGVTQHPALRCPDFPRGASAPQPSSLHRSWYSGCRSRTRRRRRWRTPRRGWVRPHFVHRNHPDCVKSRTAPPRSLLALPPIARHQGGGGRANQSSSKPVGVFRGSSFGVAQACGGTRNCARGGRSGRCHVCRDGRGGRRAEAVRPCSALGASAGVRRPSGLRHRRLPDTGRDVRWPDRHLRRRRPQGGPCPGGRRTVDQRPECRAGGSARDERAAPVHQHPGGAPRGCATRAMRATHAA